MASNASYVADGDDDKNTSPLEEEFKPEHVENHDATVLPEPESENSTGKVTLQLEEENVKKKESRGIELLYSINDCPPWHLTILLGLQHYLTMVGATITIPFILTPAMCMMDTDPDRASILSTIFFVSGLVTLLQATFGVRLPIVQGGTFSFIVPTLAILSTSFAPCEEVYARNLTQPELTEEWQVRMREVQGAIVVSSLAQMLIGFTGVIGMLLMYITPLVIAPTVCLVGLSLFDVAVGKAASFWPVSVTTMLLMMLFSQYLRDVEVPVPVYRKGEGWDWVRIKMFGLFPVLFSILISWFLCFILTVSGVGETYPSVSTSRAAPLMSAAPWLRLPYPGQWGAPTVSVAAVLGMLAGVLASVVESVGDYFACARLAGAPPPPRHALNRGIGVEGVGCMLAGLWGTGTGTTSYSENIGAIGLTKVGSRRVIQAGAAVMILFGCFGKLSAVFVSIPEPVVGGMFCIMFAMITAVGLSALQSVDLNSSRNMFVLGFPIFMGLAIPKYLNKWVADTEFDPMATAVPSLTQITLVLLQTSMFVGGFLALVLDNTVPGTREERGLVQRMAEMGEQDDEEVRHVYSLPFWDRFWSKIPFLDQLPFCPTFQGWKFTKTR